MNKELETATLAGGCFWCTEAIFKRLKGVVSVLPGYSGGTMENPSYEQVCSGMTGHAEVTQIEFDPKVISFEKILDVFWHTHDPTTLNRQGNDIGTQYRSAVFYHSEAQKEVAEKLKKEIEKEGEHKNPIVTEITPFVAFYAAEDYHKNYFDRKKDAPYCNFVISPKIHKLLEKYGQDVKEEYK
jgi:peptide-methionine (S)-S-oxide reductase